MLCQHCGKMEAEVHYTEVVDGEKRSEWLCESCAAQRGLLFPEKSPLPAPGPLQLKKSGKSPIKCPSCGMDWENFELEGKVGCEECYEVFRDELDPILRQLHRASEHRPPKEELDAQARLRRVLRALSLELAEAVRSEEFELAAQLRDEIRRYQEESEVLRKVASESDFAAGEDDSSAADPSGSENDATTGEHLSGENDPSVGEEGR